MNRQTGVRFERFHLDTVNECVRRDDEGLALTPKAFAVLRYLLEHHGRIVTKTELLGALWPTTHVGAAVLKVYVAEIRKALGDDSAAPRFIETVSRQGYRFIAPVTPSTLTPATHTVAKPPPDTLLVGRATAVTRLQDCWHRALEGHRQVVFVTGEAGIGKTTVVEWFLEHTATTFGHGIARGQCLEQYGAGEAYQPVLEALDRLCREPVGARVVTTLRRYAPTWLAQMPWLLTRAEREAPAPELVGATRERMLREIAEALEAVSAECPLIFVLEDLHWSDYATLDVVSLLAQRDEPCRLLLIATYRPAEVAVSDHPLKRVHQELQVRRHCVDLPLQFLSAAEVAKYLAVRFDNRVLPPALLRFVYRRTDGNPLFMVNVADYLIAQEWMVRHDGAWHWQAGLEQVEVAIPDSLRHMIEKQIERLDQEERCVLDAASVVGVEFSAATVAAVIDRDVMAVEQTCEAAARRQQFLRSVAPGEFPDGTVAARYSFIHELYQHILSEQIPVARRSDLHQRIGAWTAAAYGDRAGEIAAELALHFEQAHDYERAIAYHRQAALNAAHCYASEEGARHLSAALAWVPLLRDARQRVDQELALQIALGETLMSTKGFAAPEVGAAYERARQLCKRLGTSPRRFAALGGLFTFYLNRMELQTARELAQQRMQLATALRSPALLMAAHTTLGMVLYHVGEFVAAGDHLRQALALHDPQRRSSGRLIDTQLIAFGHLAAVLAVLGYPDQALETNQAALARAHFVGIPRDVAYALILAAQLHQRLRDAPATQAFAEQALAVSKQQSFLLFATTATMLRGWALAVQGAAADGIGEIRAGLTAYGATGSEGAHFLTPLIEIYAATGDLAESRRALQDAVAYVERTGARHVEAELARLRGELLLRTRSRQHLSEAEEEFARAIASARRQSAKLFELRAVMALCRSWQRRGKVEAARRRLAATYGWFTEGFATADLREAHALLHTLSHRPAPRRRVAAEPRPLRRRRSPRVQS